LRVASDILKKIGYDVFKAKNGQQKQALKMDRERIAIKDLVDLDELKLLFENFFTATGFTT